MTRRRPVLRYAALAAALGALAAGAVAFAAAPPPGHRRPAIGVSPAPPRPAPRDDEGGGDDARRPAEPSPAPSQAERDAQGKQLEVTTRRLADCAVIGADALRAELLGLQNQSDVLSLEAWGDAHEYAPYDHVFFYFRAPFAMYVTLFWLGPEAHIVVPVESLRVPGNRDVKVDTGGYIVPPLGREQWVAIGTLEPVAVGCRNPAQMQQSLKRMLALPHAIGRWEVWSKESGPVTPPL
ncbi:MAG: hypothetical protein H6745_24490 [Deltaproteobacteria bacterium]|nr:hypothetical protein [Deltaproteobacteria bacterium]